MLHRKNNRVLTSNIHLGGKEGIAVIKLVKLQRMKLKTTGTNDEVDENQDNYKGTSGSNSYRYSQRRKNLITTHCSMSGSYLFIYIDLTQDRFNVKHKCTISFCTEK